MRKINADENRAGFSHSQAGGVVSAPQLHNNKKTGWRIAFTHHLRQKVLHKNSELLRLLATHLLCTRASARHAGGRHRAPNFGAQKT